MLFLSEYWNTRSEYPTIIRSLYYLYGYRYIIPDVDSRRPAKEALVEEEGGWMLTVMVVELCSAVWRDVLNMQIWSDLHWKVLPDKVAGEVTQFTRKWRLAGVHFHPWSVYCMIKILIPFHNTR